MAEVEFLRAAMRREMVVCKPYGDNQAFDCIVYVPPRRMVRVQVKSTWGRAKWTGYSVRVGHYEVGVGFRPYTPEEVDFIVAYVEPEETWYVVPIRAIQTPNTISVFPHVKGSKAKYEKYKEAWWRLEGRRRSVVIPTIHACADSSEPLNTEDTEDTEDAEEEPSQGCRDLRLCGKGVRLGFEAAASRPQNPVDRAPPGAYDAAILGLQVPPPLETPGSSPS